MRNIFITAFILLILSISSIYGQKFQATVNTNKVSQGDYFVIEFTFSHDDVNSVKNFKAPDFSSFQILSGPSRSQNMSWVNGVVSASIGFSYYLKPKAAGSFTIGSASVDYDGKTFRTNPITITVTPGSANPNAGGRQDNSGNEYAEIAENLFIRAYVDKTDVFEGEQVTVTYKLYTRLQINTPSVSKLPSYQGFWAEEIDLGKVINLTQEVVNGKPYNVGVLKKAALFPTQTGQLAVTPLALKIPVYVKEKQKSKTGDPFFDQFFNDPFFAPTKEIDFTATSNTVYVNVRERPVDKNDPDFSGATGVFTFEAESDTKNIKTNEPFKLRLTIAGRGNLKLIDPPKIDLPSSFESYDPKINEEVNRGDVITGKKTFEFLIIPRTTGNFTIPAIKFGYFDIEKKQQVTLETKEFNYVVEKGSTEYAGSSNADYKDIRYIKKSFDGVEAGESYLIQSPVYWASVLLPFAAFAGLLVRKRKLDELRGNATLYKLSRAEKLAKKRLKNAGVLREQGDIPKFYEELARAISGYLEDKLNIPKSEFSIDNIAEKLAGKNVQEDIVNSFRSTFERCDFLRYAPVENPAAEMNEIYERVVKIIVDIENSLAGKKLTA